jgi:hypothetical protein
MNYKVNGKADQCDYCPSSGLEVCINMRGKNAGRPMHGAKVRSIKADHTNRPTTLVPYSR